MKKLLIFSCLALLWGSCEKDATVKIPEMKPMLVITGFMEAGEPIRVEVSNVVPVYAKPRQTPGPVSGAVVEISDGTNTYTLTETSLAGLYEHPSTVQAGGHYTLKVVAAGYDEVSASCQVPDYLPGQVSIEYSASSDPYAGSQDSVRRLLIKWPDQAGTNNYYRLEAGLHETVMPFSTNAMYFNNRNYNDQGKDGTTLSSGFATAYGQSYTSLSYRVYVMSLDEHSFQYMKTHDAAVWSNDNPFAEPVIEYTNIRGGIGIFGGVNRKEFSGVIY